MTWMFLVSFCGVPPTAEEFGRLCDQNKSNLQSAHIEVIEMFEGPGSKGLINLRHVWRMDGPRVRLTTKPLIESAPIDAPNTLYFDETRGGADGFRRIERYDLATQLPLDDLVDGPAKGYIGEPNRIDLDLGWNVKALLLLETSIPPYRGRLLRVTSFEDYFRSCTKFNVVESPDERPDGNYRILFERAEFGAERIYSPKAGFLPIRTISTRFTLQVQSKDASTTTAHDDPAEILEWKEYSGGVILPLLSIVRDQGLIIRTKAIVHSINQPLVESDFKVTFPNNLRVVEIKNSKPVQIHLWGQNDQSKRVFSPQEYSEWDQQFLSQRAKVMTVAKSQNDYWKWALVGAVSLVLVALAILYWKRRL